MITRLTLEQFLPFRGRVELPLAGQGLVLIRGRNEVSVAMDSNGSGKTSVLHGISWTLFGEDLSGRKADAVACRFTEGTCLGRLDMVDAIGEWSVQRTRRPTGLLTSGIPGVAENEDMASVQQKIEQRIGFGVRTFKNAVVFGQGHFDRFANADQAEQMRMLDEIQGVDFREALARAREWHVQLEGQSRQALEAGRNAVARVEHAESTIRILTGARDTYESSQRARIEKLVEVKSGASGRVDLAERDIKRAEAESAQLKALVSEKRRADDYDCDRARFSDTLRRVEQVAGEAASQLRDLTDRLRDLLKEGSCPSCRQPVKSRQKQVRKLFDQELKSLAEADREARAELKSATTNYIEASDRHKRQLDVLRKMAPEGADPQGHIGYLTRRCDSREVARRADALQVAQRELWDTDADLDKARAERWSDQATLDAAESGRVAALTLANLSSGRAEKIAAAVAMADYWVEAFGDRGIRSMLVDGVADFINERAAAHLEQLAAGEGTLRMSAQTELKRGGARERISFTPEWVWGGSGAGTGSGGQDRRIDLSLFAAIQDLAESRSARPFPIKVFDEPFDALDARGKELAVEWVRRAARDRGTALLVTHSEELAALAEPDHVWTVVMGKDGARVEVE
jgi:DNA repair exonuclease SbcCD ATPase subunit